MFRLVFALVLAATPAIAAPDPFVVYHSPAPRCDMKPASAACRAAERRDWSEFLAGKDAHFPRVTTVRLADLFDHGTTYYGWSFRIIAPQAPARWRQLAITVGGVKVATDPYDRFERQGSLVVEVVIDRARLAPGTHRVSLGSYAFDLALEDSAAPPPLDPKQLAGDLAAAATKPPFTIASLPSQPACTAQPAPAGCGQSVARMWIDLITDKRRHATTFARKSRLDGAGNPLFHWQLFAVVPTATNVELQIDRVPAKYAHRHNQRGTDAIVVDLVLLEGDHAAGKHELRAVDRSGTVLLTQTIELEK